MAYDLKLDDDGDLLFEGGDLVFTSGEEAIKQDIRARLLFFRGEWFMDEDIGLPYFTDILVKSPNFLVINSVIRTELENTPGVNEVKSLELTFDSNLRKLTVTWSVSTDVGEIGEVTEL